MCLRVSESDAQKLMAVTSLLSKEVGFSSLSGQREHTVDPLALAPTTGHYASHDIPPYTPLFRSYLFGLPSGR